MANTFTHTSEQGWFSRIMESIKSVAIGAVLFLLAFPTLFWNEGCAVRTAKSLEAGAAAVVSVATNDKVDAQYEGKLVHMTGKAVVSDELADPALAVHSPAIKLARHVDMYQWVEEKETKKEKKAGGKEVTETTYRYKTEWSDSFHDSDQFEHPEDHDNPGGMPYQNEEWHSNAVKFGAFDLPDMLIGRINKYEDFPATEDMLAKLPADLRGRAKLSASAIYVGRDANDPAIGDLRITYQVVKSDTPVSIVAQQTGSTFSRYQIPDLDAIALLEVGTVDAKAMFAQAQADAAMLCWILRFLGMAMMFGGLMMVFKPLVVVADVVPLVGNMLELGLGLVCGILAFGLSFLTISVAWVFYRPLIGIPLLIVAVGVLVGGFVMGQKKRAARGAVRA